MSFLFLTIFVVIISDLPDKHLRAVSELSRTLRGWDLDWRCCTGRPTPLTRRWWTAHSLPLCSVPPLHTPALSCHVRDSHSSSLVPCLLSLSNVSEIFFFMLIFFRTDFLFMFWLCLILLSKAVVIVSYCVLWQTDPCLFFFFLSNLSVVNWKSS